MNVTFPKYEAIHEPTIIRGQSIKPEDLQRPLA